MAFSVVSLAERKTAEAWHAATRIGLDMAKSTLGTGYLMFAKYNMTDLLHMWPSSRPSASWPPKAPLSAC